MERKQVFRSDGVTSPLACRKLAEGCRQLAGKDPRRSWSFMEMSEIWDQMAVQYERLEAIRYAIFLEDVD
jgi:hypothetical protein